MWYKALMKDKINEPMTKTPPPSSNGSQDENPDESLNRNLKNNSDDGLNHHSKTLLVINPAAGKGKWIKHGDKHGDKHGGKHGGKHEDEFWAPLKEKFTPLEVLRSQYPGHLYEIGQKAASDGFRRIITVGGDGTPFEILNGYYEPGEPDTPIQMGMIPAGTGNSFLRDFGEADPETWRDAIIKGNSRPVDVIRFTYTAQDQEIKGYFLNILGVGLIADILKLTNEKLKFLGSLGYSAAVLSHLAKGIRNRLKVTIDGREHLFQNSAMVISNSKFTGGAMKIAPMADTADGKVDVVVFNGVNRRETISIFSKIFKGTHINHPRVTILSGSHIRIEAEPPQRLMADGELLGITPMSLECLPRALNLYVPRRP